MRKSSIVWQMSIKPEGLAKALPESKESVAPVRIYSFYKGARGRHTSRPGFVLLLVVMLLAICCLIFTQLSLKSFDRVNQFVRDQRDLQQYWASTSIRKATLPNANSIWQQHRDAGLERTELIVQLSGRNYSLKLENENTKLHLGHIWLDFPVQTSRGLLQNKLIGLDASAFAKFEELNGQVDSWRLLSGRLDSLMLDQTDDITLWGSGQIDVTQTSDGTIEEAWKGLFGTFPPKGLYAAKQRWPRPSWTELRGQLGLRDTQLELADHWFSTASRCYSLEIQWQSTAHSTSGYLFIRDASNNYAFPLSQ